MLLIRTPTHRLAALSCRGGRTLPGTSSTLSLRLRTSQRTNGISHFSSTTSRTAPEIVPLIINGKDIVTDTVFAKVGPLENREIWPVSSASEEQANAAAAGAQAAFPAWAATKPSHRRDVFLRAADIMEKRKAEFGEYMRQEIGANQDYQNFILGLSIEGLKDTAGRIAGACTGTLPSSIHEGMRAMVQKRPYGVVLGIAPW
jgi:acyl-CoA reductase-like NAD-dependent aldehyde dehydrogenase